MMWALTLMLAGAMASPCEKVGVAYGDVASSIPNAGYTSDADGCQVTCGTDFNCKSYTWKENSSPKGACWHFPSAEEAQTMEPSAVSGPKTCESTVATSAGATLGNIGDAASAGINEAVDSMNGKVTAAATAVSDALPSVPPLPGNAAETATAISDALPTVPPVAAAAVAAGQEFLSTTAEPKGITGHLSSLKEKIKKSFQEEDPFTSNGRGPWYCISLILVVVAAFSLRICAHYSFNDAQNAKREEKARKAKSTATEKQAKRDLEEAVKSAPVSAISAGLGQVQQMMSGQLYQQPMVISQSQSPMYQAQPGSPTVAQYQPVYTSVVR